MFSLIFPIPGYECGRGAYCVALLSELELILEQWHESCEDGIVIISHVETGLLEHARNFLEERYGDVKVIDAAKEGIAVLYFEEPEERRWAVLLTPYQYDYIARNEELRSAFEWVLDAQPIVAYLDPRIGNALADAGDIAEKYVKEYLRRRGITDDGVIEKARKKAEKVIYKIVVESLDLPKTKEESGEEPLVTLVPIYAAEIILGDKIPRDIGIISALDKVAEVVKEAVTGLIPPNQSPLVQVLSLVLGNVIRKHWGPNAKSLIEPLTRTPKFILEEIERNKVLPPGTLTMLGRQDTLGKIIKLMTKKSRESKDKKLRELEELVEKAITQVLTNQATLEELGEQLIRTKETLAKIETRIRTLEDTIKKLFPQYCIYPVNDIDELIRKIYYVPYEGRLRDLRSESSELMNLTNEVVANTLGKGLTIVTGPTGSGKTTLAILAAKELMERGYSIHLLQTICTGEAKPITEMDRNNIILIDDLRDDPASVTLIEFLIASRTLPVIATARSYILKSALEQIEKKINREETKVIGKKDLEETEKHHIIALGLQKKYPRILLETLLKEKGISYNEEAIETIVQKAKQTYEINGKIMESSTLYYIIKLVEKLSTAGKKRITKKEAIKYPNSLFEVEAVEFLHQMGLASASIPMDDDRDSIIVEVNDRLAKLKIESDLDLLPSKIRKYCHQEGKDPYDTLVTAIAAYAIAMAIVAIGEKPITREQKFMIYKRTAEELGTETRCINSLDYLLVHPIREQKSYRGSRNLYYFTHDSYAILMNPLPYPEALLANNEFRYLIQNIMSTKTGGYAGIIETIIKITLEVYPEAYYNKLYNVHKELANCLSVKHPTKKEEIKALANGVTEALKPLLEIAEKSPILFFDKRDVKVLIKILKERIVIEVAELLGKLASTSPKSLFDKGDVKELLAMLKDVRDASKPLEELAFYAHDLFDKQDVKELITILGKYGIEEAARILTILEISIRDSRDELRKFFDEEDVKELINILKNGESEAHKPLRWLAYDAPYLFGKPNVRELIQILQNGIEGTEVILRVLAQAQAKEIEAEHTQDIEHLDLFDEEIVRELINVLKNKSIGAIEPLKILASIAKKSRKSRKRLFSKENVRGLVKALQSGATKAEEPLTIMAEEDPKLFFDKELVRELARSLRSNMFAIKPLIKIAEKSPDLFDDRVVRELILALQEGAADAIYPLKILAKNSPKQLREICRDHDYVWGGIWSLCIIANVCDV